MSTIDLPSRSSVNYQPSNRHMIDAAETEHEIIYANSVQAISVNQPTLTQKPPKGFESGVAALPVRDPAKAGVDQTPWLVQDWLRAGGVTILSARYKSLKSYLARQLAISIASGRPFLDTYDVLQDARGRPVVIVCAEERYNDVLIAIWRAANGLGINSDTLPIHIVPVLGKPFFKKENGRLVTTEPARATLKALEKIRPVLVVIDTLVAVKGEANENLADDVRPVFQWFREMGANVEATVLIVDHEGFDHIDTQGNSFARRRPRGSSDKIGAVDDAISLETSESQIDVGSLHTVEARLLHRAAAAREQTVTVVFQDPLGPIRFLGPRSPASGSTIDEESKDLIEALVSHEITSKRKLQEALEIGSPETLNELLKRNLTLVDVQSSGRGKADLVRLTDKGRDIARELGIEVLASVGAQKLVE